MSKPKKSPLKFDLYIDAAGDSASRSRSVIAILMTATFVTTLALYNAITSEYNWHTSRLTSLQNLYHWTSFPDDTNLEKDSVLAPVIQLSPDDTLKANCDSIAMRLNEFTLPEFRALAECIQAINAVQEIEKIPNHIKLKFPKYSHDSSGILSSTIDQSEFERAINSIKTQRSITREELSRLIILYDRSRIENSVLIDIPVLGISFDINGLGFISPAAFSIIFFLLYYNLARERQNLVLVFKVADIYEIERSSLYQILSMRQVLTVPHSIDEYLSESLSQSKEKKYFKIKDYVLKKLPILPLILPIIIWLIVIIHDIITAPAGNAISQKLTIANYAISVVCGTIMILLFWLCLSEWKEISQIYKNEADIIAKELSEKQKPLTRLPNEL